MQSNGVWLSIIDYAKYRNISISTIRRYIKASRVVYKKENGKFFIFVSDENSNKLALSNKEDIAIQVELEKLRNQNRSLLEENNELRMLVDLYEGNQRVPLQSKRDLPELPNEH